MRTLLKYIRDTYITMMSIKFPKEGDLLRMCRQMVILNHYLFYLSYNKNDSKNDINAMTNLWSKRF
jgi:hypothetical protein